MIGILFFFIADPTALEALLKPANLANFEYEITSPAGTLSKVL